MSLKGQTESYIKLRGSISLADIIHGKSAYDIAVANGFNGTEEEWLESLKSVDVQKVVDMVLEQMVKPAKIGEVTLLAAAWVGEENLFSQVVEVDGATANSQVDLTPDVEQLSIFYEKDLTFVTENDNGIITVYAIGQKPENDYTIQVTITEVAI